MSDVDPPRGGKQPTPAGDRTVPDRAGAGETSAPYDRLGDFEILREIGRGGMGVVYEARQISLDRRVALKVLPAETTADPARLQRFEREAKALAALDHPNIVTVHSVEQHGDVHFICMQLVQGQPLSEQITEGGLSVERFVDLAIPLADAVSAAHEKGITHRDLKPANVMLDENGRVKILDFGLAKLRRERPAVEDPLAPTESMTMTRAGTLLGTFPYMSPEQVEGKSVDQRSDLFSLGVVLYEMATGRRPFRGETQAALVSSILRETPQPLTSINPGLPADLQRIVAHCLKKNPEQRYQTAKGLRNELQELKASTTGAPAPAISRFKRLAWPAVALLVALGAWVGYRQLRAPPATLTERKMIVVLPFENLGPPEEAYFASGMTEEITSRLAVVSGLGVISRTSAMQYEGADKSIKQIGEELGVGYVLEGTVRWDRSGGGHGRVRITPQLIRVADDTHLWADRYDEVLDDIFEVQSEIAEQVTQQLGVALLTSERRTIETRPTQNMDAYRAYLRGLDLGYPASSADVTMTKQMFERAVRLDPEFGLAWSELARILGWAQHAESVEGEDPLRAAQASREALRLAPDSPDVHRNLGFCLYWGLRDFEGALEHFSIAIRLRPNDGLAYVGKGGTLRAMGRFEEGLAAKLKGIELDPRYPEYWRDAADSYLVMRDFPEAERFYDRAISLAPDNRGHYFWKSWSYLRADGDTERARSVLEALPGEPAPVYSWYLLDVYERNWQRALDRLSAEPSESTQPAYGYGKPSWGYGDYLTPGRFPREYLECYCLLHLGQESKDVEACRRATTLLESRLEEEPDNPRLHTALGMTHALLGRTDEAIRAGRRGVELGREVYRHAMLVQPEIGLAKIYAWVGDEDAALETIEHLLSMPSILSVGLLRMDPAWDPLRENPRFEAILERERQSRSRRLN